jgi:hypothetical protein
MNLRQVLMGRPGHPGGGEHAASLVDPENLQRTKQEKIVFQPGPTKTKTAEVVPTNKHKMISCNYGLVSLPVVGKSDRRANLPDRRGQL